jgi:hypothetical protein
MLNENDLAAIFLVGTFASIIYGLKNMGKTNQQPKKTKDNSNTQTPYSVPTDDNFIGNVCLSYDHSFGLLTPGSRAHLVFQCKEWIRAINNNIGAEVWITDRLPVWGESTQVWVSRGKVVEQVYYGEVREGEPWIPIHPPSPPKPYHR